jgi:hypothetical protein
MMNLMTDTFCHPRVIHENFGIFKSCLSLKIICGVVKKACVLENFKLSSIKKREY